MKKIFIPFIILLITTSNIFAQVRVGADRLEILLPKLEGKRVGLVANHTSCLSTGTHLLDTLVTKGVQVKDIFAPEHGFRGTADAGEVVVDGKDKRTGVKVTSLYGKNKKPSAQSLSNIDILIFDIQDVGARFYTYISTMHYVMEACAENNILCIILDRPNPNDHVDGPILEKRYKSFVGMHPIPVLHGLTTGELAQMINGEGWLSNGTQCKLEVIEVEGWKHKQPYILSIKPSPNLPNQQSVLLYPSLCFFEATEISVGRGTEFPFQVAGAPSSVYGEFTFTPRVMEGSDKNPLQKEKLCYGLDLRQVETDGSLTLKYLIDFYKQSRKGAAFFKSPRFMDLLAGTNKLRKQILMGVSEDKIRKTWQADLDKYKEIRKKYLLYAEYK